MRTFIASLRIATLLMIFALPVFVGCGGGGSNDQEALGKDSEPPFPGAVWNDTGEYWEQPSSGYGDDGGGYDDNGYDDEDSSDDDDASDEVADQNSNSDYEDEYANGRPDPDANNGGNNNGYADNGYGDTDPYAKPSDSGNGGDGADAYASNSDGGYGQPAGGGGSGVYAEKIEPLFRAHCYNCHGGGARGKKGGFSLHTPAAIQEQGTYLIKSREPEESEIYLRLSMDPDNEDRMPPKGPGLSPEEVALVKDWIQSGASFGGNQGGGYGEGYADGGQGGRGSGRDEDPYEDRDEPGNRAPAPPKNLAEASSVTFQRGNDLEAMNQLYAQTLVRDSEVADAVLENYRYVPALRRARLAVRWGIGVVYKPLYKFEGSPRAPGVNQDLRDVDDAEDVDDYADLQFKNQGLDYYTGDIGDEILLRLASRIERSFYGEVLRVELEKKLSGGDDDEDYDDAYGDGGGYGGGGRGGRGGGYGGDGGGSSEKPDDDRVEQIMPGVMMLGQAGQAKLFERAAEQGVDLVVIVDIKTKPDNRNKIAESTYRVRLFDAVTRTQLATSGRILNLDVQKKRAEDPTDETIIKEIDKIFAVADEGAKIKDKTIRPYKVTEFPSGQSDKVKKGTMAIVSRLVKEPKENPLAELSEVRFYESRGLLKSTVAAKAFEKLTPKHAAMLAKVSDENELRTTLTDWLVVDEPATSGDEEDGEPRRRPRRGFR